MKKQKENLKVSGLLSDIDSEVDMIREEINMLLKRVERIDDKIHEIGSEL